MLCIIWEAFVKTKSALIPLPLSRFVKYLSIIHPYPSSMRVTLFRFIFFLMTLFANFFFFPFFPFYTCALFADFLHDSPIVLQFRKIPEPLTNKINVKLYIIDLGRYVWFFSLGRQCREQDKKNGEVLHGQNKESRWRNHFFPFEPCLPWTARTVHTSMASALKRSVSMSWRKRIFSSLVCLLDFFYNALSCASFRAFIIPKQSQNVDIFFHDHCYHSFLHQ